MIEQILQADRYLQVDQVEKARDVYQKVVDMDPGNAIAVVGLARCALADGKDQEAYELASRALEIDPETDMARRMEARLSEILATRGAPVERPDAAAEPSSVEMRQVVTAEGPAEEPDAEPGGGAAEIEVAAAGSLNQDTPESAAQAEATAPPEPERVAATATPTTTRPSKPKEPPVRKSLFDRLMGR